MQISELSAQKGGTWINDTLAAVSEIKTKTTKAGKPYAEITLSDSSGSITSPVWNITDVDGIKCGDIVLIDAMLDFYNQSPQLTNMVLKKVTDFEDVDLSGIVPTYNIPNELMSYFKSTIDSLIFPYNNFAKNCTGLDVDPELFSKFCRCPSAIRHHGNKIGGLFLHTVGVMKNVENTLKMYVENPFFAYGKIAELNKDRLMLKAVIHDIAKMQDYNFDSTISWSGDSKLDHRGKGVRYIERVNIKLGDLLDEEEMNNITYSILSHHGAFGNGQYVFDNIEDYILHMADAMDAMMVSSLENANFKL